MQKLADVLRALETALPEEQRGSLPVAGDAIVKEMWSLARLYNRTHAYLKRPAPPTTHKWGGPAAGVGGVTGTCRYGARAQARGRGADWAPVGWPPARVYMGVF